MLSLSDIRSSRLGSYLALASFVSIAALTADGVLGLVSLRRSSVMMAEALEDQSKFLHDATAFQLLLYQRGFVTQYLLTGDQLQLARLEESRQSFLSWFARAQRGAPSEQGRRIVAQIAKEYLAYDERRASIVALAEAGQHERAQALLGENHVHMERLIVLFQSYQQAGEAEAAAAMREAEAAIRRDTTLLLLASVAGAAASLAVGFLMARRVGRPIYELQLQIEAAAERTRIAVVPGREGLSAMSEQVGAIVRRLEETDAAVLEQRRRLVQIEKLSAVGELAAKLAHELLNPLAGMKAAAQLLLRTAAPALEQVHETALALDREIGRIDKLLRRLVHYARPLQPRLEPISLPALLDEAVMAAAPELSRAGIALRREEDPALPRLMLDPLLMTQVVVNLLINAAHAGPGSPVIMATRVMQRAGQEHVCISVSDEGPGIRPEHLDKVFHPFFTTKPQGNGLGLAVSQNIVVEHGGCISYHDREDGRGARFEVLLPVVR